MKILTIVPSYKPAYIYGGPIESVARLCEGLVSSGNVVDVFTTTANGNKELEVKPGSTVNVDGVSVTYFRRITKDHTHISPALWKSLNNNVKKYDIVHIHSWWNILVMVAAWICHQSGVKVIISPRGMLSAYIINTTHSIPKKILHKSFGRKALAKAVFHATAVSEKNECEGLIPNWKGFLLPNILNLPESIIIKPDNETFTLVFLSRIHPKKGIELLLEAVAQCKLPLKLEIAGSGEQTYISELQAKTAILGIEEKVDWIGWKNYEEKFDVLMQADLFVLTSYNENFANVVIEALHVGTPVLISEQVGLASFVQENNLGWVSALKVSAIKAAIEEAYWDKEKRAYINIHAKDTIHKNFSQEVLIKEYENNYRSLMA
ncbi:glycosyltransferase [Porifericola rhodea]|uniref:XrtY-associated glycosyltransferase XYAG1 n=1 Tax=Porifericola rhodea TaxID=930972 RepID=UPI00266518BF|nr:glycosyltransferase [Porifericola rhodea]WKN32545.1 glycosyltransferase [Porifericola rhodea]